MGAGGQRGKVGGNGREILRDIGHLEMIIRTERKETVRVVICRMSSHNEGEENRKIEPREARGHRLLNSLLTVVWYTKTSTISKPSK